MKRALRLLDVEGVYNHLYAISALCADDTYEAQDRLRAVWSLILESTQAGFDDRDKAFQIDQLRDLAGRFLRVPYLQSMELRNFLVSQIFDAVYPAQKRISDKLAVAIFLAALGVGWFFDQYLPELKLALVGSVGLALLGWYLIRHRRRGLLDHLRDELRSGVFKDSVVRAQLEALDRRSPQLPSAIYELLEVNPPTFTEAEMDRLRSTIPAEQWKHGLRIKSEWQKELLRATRES